MEWNSIQTRRSEGRQGVERERFSLTVRKRGRERREKSVKDLSGTSQRFTTFKSEEETFLLTQ